MTKEWYGVILLPEKYILFKRFKKSPCENVKEKNNLFEEKNSPWEHDKEKKIVICFFCFKK